MDFACISLGRKEDAGAADNAHASLPGGIRYQMTTFSATRRSRSSTFAVAAPATACDVGRRETRVRRRRSRLHEVAARDRRAGPPRALRSRDPRTDPSCCAEGVVAAFRLIAATKRASPPGSRCEYGSRSGNIRVRSRTLFWPHHLLAEFRLSAQGAAPRRARVTSYSSARRLGRLLPGGDPYGRSGQRRRKAHIPPKEPVRDAARRGQTKRATSIPLSGVFMHSPL